MTDDDRSKSEPEDSATDEPRKPRRHGYRGYPNNPKVGGGIHTGTGFAGVGSTGGAESSGSNIITEKTRESVEELGEEEEDK